MNAARITAASTLVGFCALLASGQHAVTAPVDRAAALVNSFQVMCTIQPIDFARLDQKATAMKLPVRKDLKSPPNPNGFFVESKS